MDIVEALQMMRADPNVCVGLGNHLGIYKLIDGKLKYWGRNAWVESHIGLNRLLTLRFEVVPDPIEPMSFMEAVRECENGKDITNIRQGKLVGKNNDQDLMAAGNAIERAHKNISEIANFMLGENHFPYILFLTGSNFLTVDIDITRPDGRVVTLKYNSGILNRLDRLTASNYGLPINQNLCQNRFVPHNDKMIMLQATSVFTQPKGEAWDDEEMLAIMVDVAKTSLRVLGADLFNQITNAKGIANDKQ